MVKLIIYEQMHVQIYLLPALTCHVRSVFKLISFVLFFFTKKRVGLNVGTSTFSEHVTQHVLSKEGFCIHPS
jgi:hypothetical protein